MTIHGHNFFSVDFDLILLDHSLPYDIYINSSAINAKEKFVKLVKQKDKINNKDLEVYKNKYHRLYLMESQREIYLKSLQQTTAQDNKKAEVIKSAAITHLDKLFEKNHSFDTELLNEAIIGCKASVESMVGVIKNYSVSNLQNLIASLSFHDFYTYDHSINVSMYCISLYQLYNPKATNDQLVMAGLGGLLHDLGKINISTDILNNPGKLSDSDFELIKRHPVDGFNMLNDSAHISCDCEVNMDILKRVVLEHHENYNGTGYPYKKKENEIHLLARITAIADFFDAITTKRSYHDVLSVNDALSVMEKSVGKKIDPELFEIFKNHIRNNDILHQDINQCLPDDFDPCQPHSVLPLAYPDPTYKIKDFTKKIDKKSMLFGKIKNVG